MEKIELVEEGPDTFFLADYARDLGVDPKLARKRMRSALGTLDKHNKKRWSFRSRDCRAVGRIIRGL